MKKTSETSLLFIGIYACMMLWIGCFLGFISLILFPLKSYAKEQEHEQALEERAFSHPMPGDAYYIEGPISRSSSWELKRQQLIDGSASTIRISVGEVNAWLNAKFRALATPQDEEARGLIIEPDRPNVGISEAGTIYLNLPTKLTGYGLDGGYVMSARVRFKDGAPARLAINRLQIAGAAVPFPRLIGSGIASRLIAAFSSAEEYGVMRDAWQAVQSVETADSDFILHLNRP